MTPSQYLVQKIICRKQRGIKNNKQKKDDALEIPFTGNRTGV